MIVIVLSVCLVAIPHICRDQVIPTTQASPMGCMMKAPPRMALWAEEHPEWRIVRWQCRAARPGDI
jgi:hypothetical protein